MHKKIEFYKVICDFLPMQDYNKSEEELKVIFINNIFNSIKPGDQHITKMDELGSRNVLIEIIDISNDCLFGIIGKLEDLKDGILKRFRSKEDRIVVNSDEKDINLFIENYTYFYFQFTNLICAVLSNYSAPKFRTHFCNYLNDVVSPLLIESLRIVNVLDNDIDYKINRITDLNEIKLIFDESSIIGNELLNLTDTFYLSQSSLREASINIAFKMNSVKDKTKRILKNSELIKTDFKKFELIGMDENENDIQIELVERILSKKVFIDINEEYLKSSDDLEKIKKVLAKAISPT